MFTGHKTITALDSTPSLVLAGFEDGVVKAYDLRSSTKAQAVLNYTCHDKWVSQVKTNPVS